MPARPSRHALLLPGAGTRALIRGPLIQTLTAKDMVTPLAMNAASLMLHNTKRGLGMSPTLHPGFWAGQWPCRTRHSRRTPPTLRQPACGGHEWTTDKSLYIVPTARGGDGQGKRRSRLNAETQEERIARMIIVVLFLSGLTRPSQKMASDGDAPLPAGKRAAVCTVMVPMAVQAICRGRRSLR
jgi:hypothetical protein